MIRRLLVCLALASGPGAASAQPTDCTLYKVNASVLPITKNAGGGGNIGALEDGDVTCVTRQQQVDGADWGYIPHSLDKTGGRKPINGWATLRYLQAMSPTEIAAFEAATKAPPPAAAVLPAAPAAGAAPPSAVTGKDDAGAYQRASEWTRANPAIATAIGAGAASALLGLLFLAVRRKPTTRAPVAVTPLTDGKTRIIDDPDQPMAYGWLETLDANPTRYPLGAIDVRIGRDDDNEVRLKNDSISRRHALLQFNSDNRRFVLKDLGGSNGTFVNKVRKTSHELQDGDLLRLGEVQLRFRANNGLLGQ